MRINNSKGLTLFEVLIAAFVFTLAIGAILVSVESVICLIDLSKQQTVAVSDLQNIMEKLRTTAFANIVALFPHNVIDGQGSNTYYTLIGGYTLTGEHIVVSYQDLNSDPLEIKTEVTWQDKRNRTHNITMSTFRTR